MQIAGAKKAKRCCLKGLFASIYTGKHSFDHEMVHFNDSAGKHSAEVPTTKPSESHTMEETSFSPQKVTVNDQSDYANPDACMQHTYAALEPHSAGKENRLPRSSSKARNTGKDQCMCHKHSGIMCTLQW